MRLQSRRRIEWAGQAGIGPRLAIEGVHGRIGTVELSVVTAHGMRKAPACSLFGKNCGGVPLIFTTTDEDAPGIGTTAHKEVPLVAGRTVLCAIVAGLAAV